MAKFVDKVQIQTAVKNWRDFDLSCSHLTTQFFMRTGIAYSKEFPASKIKLNLQTYGRMMPLQKPVMGSVQVHNRVFHVPFRTVWRPFNNFLTQSPYTNGSGTLVPNTVPSLSPSVLLDVLVNHSTVASSGAEYDFSSGNTNYILDYKGRHYYKVLRQLGYAAGDNKSVRVSALPLLCFARLFMDWYFPAQYAHTGLYAYLDGFFNRDFYYELTSSEIDQILEATRCTFYGNDYFCAAWENPVSPVGGTFEPNISIPDITFDVASSDTYGISTVTNSTTSLGSNQYHTPYVSNTVNSYGVRRFTQYADDSLKALTNYMKRHQLVGARVLDRYLADFQVVPKSEIIARSQYIGTQSFPIQFQDVMSNSDTITQNGGQIEGAQLGDYAGKGTAFDGRGNFEFDTQEYGMVIVINDVTPDIAYYQGIDRSILHRTFDQFFQPEFEKLGTQPLLQVEVNGDFSSDDYQSLFAFQQRYAEYKVGMDKMTGLFTLDSQNTGLLGWSTVRQVAAGQTHSFNFLRGDDSWQYARIFFGPVTGVESELDKFIFIHRINIKASMQMSPLYDTYDFDEPEGDEITMQANGTQFK